MLNGNFRFLMQGFVFLICLWMFSSCGMIKRVEGSKLKKKSLKFIENKVAQNFFEADWLRMKAKMTASDGKQKQSFNADVRLRKDSVLWISISPTILKIEVARILIDKDSVKVINRLQKQYYETTVDFLESLANYPLDFNMLQNIFFGNPIVEGDKKSALSITKAHYCLENALKDLDLTVCVEPENYTIAQMSVQDEDAARYLQMNLEEYEKIDKQLFSKKRFLSIETPQKYTVDIKLSRIKVNEVQRTNFEVPEKYKKVDRLELK